MPDSLLTLVRTINWNSSIVNAVLNAVAIILAAALTVVVPYYLTRTTPASQPPVENHVLDELEKISKNTEYEIKPSPAIDDSLIGILSKANHKLFEHYWALEGKKQKDAKTDLVYFMGPAGAGKSTLLKTFRPEDACYVDLKNAFDQGGTLSKYSKEQSDLEVGQRRFNVLPGVAGQRFSLRDILKDVGCCTAETCKRLVILDGLDELHPELSTLTLKVINSDLQSKADAPLPAWLLVAGRPEGFHYYLSNRSTVPSGAVTIHFELPKYDTAGKLNALLKDLYGNQNRVLTQEEEKAFANLISTEPWLSYTISHLSYARSMNEFVRVDKNDGYSELKDAMFDNILQSNYQSHRRPMQDNAVYVSLLEEIAARYAEEAVRHDGYFSVDFQDMITVYADREAGTQLGTLPVREVLNRSGIAYLDPAELWRTRYRFQPKWIHGYLAERWNRRITKEPEKSYWLLKSSGWRLPINRQ